MLRSVTLSALPWLASALVLAAPVQKAVAAPAAAYITAIEGVLRQPGIIESSTTPRAQLVSGHNTLVALHTSTEETVAAMERLIEGARSEVLLQIYEYDDGDEAAKRVFTALQHRVRRAVATGEALAVGVVVGRAWPSEHALQQRDLEGLVHEVQVLGRAAQHVTVVLSRYRGSLLSILHSKILITDAQDALVMTGNLITHGGIASDSRNMAAHVRGPVVDTLRADWTSAYSVSTVAAQTGPGSSTLGVRALEVPAAAPVKAVQEELYAAVLSRPSRWAPWSDGAPSLQAAGIVQLLATATEDIAIVNPSIGADAVRGALRDAVLRGVRVKAVLSRCMNADREHHLFGGDNAEQAFKLYSELLQQGGVQAAERLQILWGSTDGVTPGATRSAGNIHAKVTAIDDACLMVGSTNFNWLSFNTSREVTVALMGPDVARVFRQGIWPQLVNTAVPLRAQDVPQCGGKGRAQPACAHLARARGSAK